MSYLNELFFLFGIPASAVIIMHELTIGGYRVWARVVNLLPVKPFTCELCMSFWLYFLLHGLFTQFDVSNLLGAFLSAFLGYIFALKFIKF